MDRKQNVIIFSAGESLEKANICKKKLGEMKIDAYVYKDLFLNVFDQDHIALLPNLIKKIPTFDFAIILAEGVDETLHKRQESRTTMRDNLLFELGLCIMGLGEKRVILLTKKEVHIPDDLMGLGSIGIKKIEFTDEEFDEVLVDVLDHINKSGFLMSLDRLAEYIYSNYTEISPIMVGASVASAEAYFMNFILRIINNAGEVFLCEDGFVLEFNQIEFRIFIPRQIDEQVNEKICKFYKAQGLSSGTVKNAGVRDIEFRFIQKGESLIVMDVPTSITASFFMVNEILSLESEEENDDSFKDRFIMKEIDIYIYALEKLAKSKLKSLNWQEFKRDGKKMNKPIIKIEKIDL